jgi:hypothetical protein
MPKSGLRPRRPPELTGMQTGRRRLPIGYHGHLFPRATAILCECGHQPVHFELAKAAVPFISVDTRFRVGDGPAKESAGTGARL